MDKEKKVEDSLREWNHENIFFMYNLQRMQLFHYLFIFNKQDILEKFLKSILNDIDFTIKAQVVLKLFTKDNSKVKSKMSKEKKKGLWV